MLDRETSSSITAELLYVNMMMGKRSREQQRVLGFLIHPINFLCVSAFFPVFICFHAAVSLHCSALSHTVSFHSVSVFPFLFFNPQNLLLPFFMLSVHLIGKVQCMKHKGRKVQLQVLFNKHIFSIVKRKYSIYFMLHSLTSVIKQ